MNSATAQNFYNLLTTTELFSAAFHLSEMPTNQDLAEGLKRAEGEVRIVILLQRFLIIRVLTSFFGTPDKMSPGRELF